ncbi:MAG: glycosyltransferase [Candidatus Hydrogenedentes bacterium]|nr:glycosyltransferase [Candidatus Hydrogenedentota bacterium]
MPSRPLTILLSDPHLKGGGQVRYVTELARELTRLGHAVYLGCKPDSVLVACARDAECRGNSPFAYRGGLRPRAWFGDLRRLARFIREVKPDVLHANGSQDHWISGLGNRLLGRPVCMVRTRHNTYAVGNSLPNRLLNLSWTDYQIAVCDAVLQLRISRPTFDAERMRVIHNGVDPKKYCSDAAARTRTRQEFGYADEHIVVGMAARLAEAKGHRFLFEAAAKLKSQYPQLRLLILGQGVLDQSLRDLARDLEIDSITHFGGFRNDIGDCIQAFDIGAQPSIDCEASSFSVMEQMATEIPIVASDHGGTKEIVRDGKDGFIVPQGTVEPLADALARLLRDPAQRRAMGQSARKRIESEFTLGLLASRTLEAYDEALSIHAKRRAT